MSTPIQGTASVTQMQKLSARVAGAARHLAVGHLREFARLADQAGLSDGTLVQVRDEPDASGASRSIEIVALEERGVPDAL